MGQTLPDESVERGISETLLVHVPLGVLGASTIYSAILGWLERKYPIKPDHTLAEVVGGVLLTLVPVALAARNKTELHWRVYEGSIWRCFFAAGMPIVLWQLGEAVARQIELLRYATSSARRSDDLDADHTSPLASGSRERS